MLASRAAAALRNWGFSGTTLISRLRDAYWKYVTLLLRGNNADVDYALTASPDVLAFNRDSSANNFELTLAGNTKPSVFNPYQNGYYSCFFDGTGDFITSSGSNAFTFGTGDFTVEYWVYHTAVAATYNQHVGAATTSAGFAFGTNGTALKMYMTTSTVGYTSTGTSFVLNRWHHVAYCRLAGTVTFFLDGAVNYSTAAATNITETNFGLGATPSGTSYPMTGYLSNVRVVKGQALYQAQFTPSTVPLTAITGTSLLACQAARLADNSPANAPLTRNGDVAVRQAHPFALGYSATVPTGYSVYFDGTGDYITLASNSAFNFGTGDFTIEAWIYLNSISTNKVIIDTRSIDSLSSYVFNVQTTGKLDFIYGASRLTSATILVTGRWFHVAVTRSNSVISQFINGQVDGNTVTYASAIDATAAPWIGGGRADASGNPGYYLVGCISNLRVVKGTAVYTTGFTPSTTALTAVTGTSLLTCQDAVIKDNSTNAFALTRVGDTVASNFHPFGNAATVKLPASYYGVYFDGTGDYITLPAAGILNYGTGDFNFECWIYVVGSGASQTVIAARFWVTIGPTTLGLTSAGITGIYALTGLTNIQYKWAHVAISRASGTLRSFINGAQVDSRADSTNFETTGGKIGIESGSLINPFTGIISNLRSIKGSALYTAAFTPSTTPLTAVSGTTLLTCQSATIVDNSSNVHSLTINGDASPVYVNLVDSSTGLDTRYLGSAYFDGTYDYFEIASNAAFGFGTGDYTLEAWVYIIGAATTNGYMILDFRNVGNGADGKIILYLNNANALTVNIGTTIIIASGVTILQNQWYHVALARSGTNTRLFVNGAQKGSTYVGSQDLGAAARPVIGNVADASATYNASWNGYISDVRIVKGSAVYTTAFIPPVQPLTAVTNTQLLTLQTRGSLSNNFFADSGSTSNSVITKNGNAGLSTFTPDGGGWSAYFDGSGDYLSIANSSAFDFGTGDFTVEFWMYAINMPNTAGIIGKKTSDSTNGWQISYNSTYANKLTIRTTLTNDFTSTSSWSLNTWEHWAVARSGSTIRWFKNGILDNSASNTYNISETATTYIGYSQTWGGYYTGYISNLRVVKGQALYTATFTTSTTPLTPITSNATVSTSLLTCNDSYLKDWSHNNFTVTKAGDTAILRANPFGNYQVTPKGYGYLFAGAGSYLTSTTTIDMYAQPITIEAWIYPTTAGFAPIVEENTGGSNGEQLMYINGSQFIVFEQRNTHGYGSTIGLTTTATAPINTWTHFAMCLTASGPRIYVNGVQSATDATLRYWANAARNFNIGLNGYGGTGFPGYISNLRVSKGVRYTATFTPSTTPFVADSATSLLTCQSTLIEDNSYTRNTLTMTGTVKPLEFNPFGYNTVEVDNVPTSVGTSLILDGTGDNLSIPTSTSLGLGTGDFTMECWIYATSNPANGPGTLLDLRTGSTASATTMRINASFQMMVYNGPSNVETTFTTVVAGLNAWYHIAYVRRSGTVYGYINSLLAGSVAISTDLGTTQPLLIGQNQTAGYNFYGYIFDYRISKGTGAYATSFLPIRAVKPAPGQTSFALDPTTVGIYDSAGQRGFSTEGDAKLSVTQKKYGSTSMYFDGNGDYLQFPYMERIMPTQSMMTSSWTWECWVYIVARHTASDSWDWPVLFGGPGNIFAIGPTSIGRLRVQWYIGGSGGERRCTGSSTVPLTTWTHLAVAVTAGAFKFFINGVQETLDTSYSNSQTSFLNNIFTTTGTMCIGGGFGRGSFSGYVDDLRITNGYVRYTANFDAPAALVAAGPLT